MLIGFYPFYRAAQDWDHFVFAQSWPPGTCADGKMKVRMYNS